MYISKGKVSKGEREGAGERSISTTRGGDVGQFRGNVEPLTWRFGERTTNRKVRGKKGGL